MEQIELVVDSVTAADSISFFSDEGMSNDWSEAIATGSETGVTEGLLAPKGLSVVTGVGTGSTGEDEEGGEGEVSAEPVDVATASVGSVSLSSDTSSTTS